MRFGLGLEALVPYVLYIGGLIAVVAAMVRPKYGIYYLVPLLPLQTIRYRMFELPLAQYLVDVVLLAVAIGLLINQRSLFPKVPIRGLLLVFMGYIFFSLWWGSLVSGFPLPLSFDEPRTDFWKNYMVLPILFFFTVSSVREKSEMQTLLLLMCVGAVALAKSFGNNISGRDYSQFSYDLRSSAAVGYAGVNGLAAFQVQFGVLSATLAIFEKRFWRKVMFTLVASASLYCVMYALSRGAYAALLVCWVYVGVVRRKPLLLAALVLFLIFWQALVPGAVRERVLMTVDASGAVDESSSQRLSLWEAATQVIEANPIVGKGLHTYAFLGIDEHFRDTHNLYLKLMLETGVVGLMLFLYFLFFSYRMGVRLYRIAEDPFLRSFGLGFAIFIVALTVVNVFGDRWYYLQVSGYTWVLLAMVARGTLLVMEQSQAEAAAAPASASSKILARPSVAVTLNPGAVIGPAHAGQRRPVAWRQRMLAAAKRPPGMRT